MDESKIDASVFAYDLNAIVDFIFQNQNKEKRSEIQEIYSKDPETKDFELVQKTLTETKNEELTAAASIRYDLVKMLIEQVNSIMLYPDYLDIDEDGDIDSEDEINTEAAPHYNTLGETFALNTLTNEGMLISVNKDDLIKNG